MDIDLTLDLVITPSADVGDVNTAVQRMLQRAADTLLGDWFDDIVGPPVMDLTAAPYGGARYPVEARLDGGAFARFRLDAGVGDVVIEPRETIQCRD